MSITQEGNPLGFSVEMSVANQASTKAKTDREASRPIRLVTWQKKKALTSKSTQRQSQPKATNLENEPQSHLSASGRYRTRSPSIEEVIDVDAGSAPRNRAPHNPQRVIESTDEDAESDDEDNGSDVNLSGERVVDPDVELDSLIKLLLSHIRNRLSAHSTRALLCLGAWGKLGYVDNKDLILVSKLPDVSQDNIDPIWDKD
ncbi:hypothetical protein BDQ17DRAFT_1430787 [Cyathus striatus]|nr:hypothetical protein BDQ17DRAFT_1430787 [Cyathus striatus]